MKRILLLILVLLFASLPSLAEADLICRTDNVELHLPGSWFGKILILPTANGAAFCQKTSFDKYMDEEHSYPALFRAAVCGLLYF